VRAYLPTYDLRAPENLTAALALLDREPDAWKPIAGGTDLMVLFDAGKLEHKKLLSIWKLGELRGIEVRPDQVTLGALTTYTQVQTHPVLQKEFPLLCRAAAETGGIATQNRGTLAGNIANASPAADSPPALLVYDAALELVSAQGSRWVSYYGFHTGYKQTILRPEELIRRIRLPRRAKTWRQHYSKVGTRKAQAISKVCFAASAEMEGHEIRDIRIALGSVAPTVIRCPKTEALLKEQEPSPELIAGARAALRKEIAPIDDMRSTAEYRTRVAQNLLEEFLLQLGTDGQSRTAAHPAHP
jgi:CO/xanthine dehydrogenase FAD-binding subunit